jgi:hypothetical protein
MQAIEENAIDIVEKLAWVSPVYIISLCAMLD